MIDKLDNVSENNKCSVCSCDFTENQGGIIGYFGIIPVAFCPTCLCSMLDMADQLKGEEI
jgi:hypothetical protein